MCVSVCVCEGGCGEGVDLLVFVTNVQRTGTRTEIIFKETQWRIQDFPLGRGTPTPKVGVLLPPATKLGQGNIFSRVCQEFCPQGRGYLGRYTPQAGTPPPGQVHHPLAGTPTMVNERAVSILLECILVLQIFLPKTA